MSFRSIPLYLFHRTVYKKVKIKLPIMLKLLYSIKFIFRVEKSDSYLLRSGILAVRFYLRDMIIRTVSFVS